jgi:hypothetical protein
MQRSSESVASLAAALAKAQTELINPEKSLVGTLEVHGSAGAARSFRYAPLAKRSFEAQLTILTSQEIEAVSQGTPRPWPCMCMAEDHFERGSAAVARRRWHSASGL